MKQTVAAVLIFLLSACAVRSNQYYLPVDPLLAKEGTVCGFVPWGSAKIPLAEGFSAGINITPVKGMLSATIQLSIPTGMTIRFTQKEVRFTVPSTGAEYVAPLTRWQVGVYGRGGSRGYHEYFDSDAVLEGRGRNADLASADTPYVKADLFISGASVQAPTITEMVMTLPPLEINGVAFQSKVVPLRLVEKSGVMTCVQ